MRTIRSRSARLAGLLGLTGVALATALACQAPAAPATTPAAGTTPPPAAAATTAPSGTAPAAAATAAASPAAKAPAAPAGKVTFGLVGTSFAQFNPQEVISGVNAFWYWPAFDGLTWVDRSGQLQQGLATGWTTTDARTWRFTMREGARFHNGDALTAQDVADTFNFVRNPDNRQRALTSFADVTNVTAPDPRTVVIELRQPVPAFPKSISLVMVTEGRKLAQQGTDYLENAVGTGPFKQTSWSANQAINYQAMGTNWTTARGVPNVNEVTLRFVADPATLVAALRTGEVDLATSISADAVPELQSQFEIKPTVGTAEWHYDLNTFSGPFADVKVRQAANYAVNRAQILQSLFGGFGVLDGQMIGKDVLGYDPAIQPYATDLNRAQALMREAGVSNAAVTMSVIGPASGPGGANVASAIQADLARIGINATLETQDTTVWLAAFSGPQAQRKDISYATINWERTFEPDSVWRFWSSDRTPETGRRWMDETFDRLYQTAKNTIDERQRGIAYQAAGRYLHENAPVLYLYLLNNPVAISRQVSWNPGLFADAYTTQLSRR